MPGRPDPVRIDDLGAPRLAPHVAAMLEGAREMAAGVDLAPAALCDRARAETGLEDFGPDDFRERLDVLAASLDTEAGLSAFGRLNAQALLVSLLKNRLRIEDLVRRHPEILDVEIARPIVICGLPRTGTTHLHNLMSADPALRSLPYWESLEPVPADSERPAPGEPDPRIVRTDAALALLNDALPHFKRMHEMTTWHVHEEIQLLAIDFSTMLFETVAPVPSWRDYYRSHDQTPSYRYLRKILQVLQWLRGGTRWVLKSPQHLEQFGPLSTVFPDATYVVTHRDPVAVTVSLCTMIAYSARLSAADPDPCAVGRYWSSRIEDMLRACVRDRDVLPAAQSLDVRFDEFMADDVAMVERIYALAGQPFTASVRGAMDAFMAEHPRGRHGAVLYDAAQLGIDPEERRRALAFYSERFGVRAES
ncbi:MAG TPA: sulfotransferase [Acidimicrobiia bacterium]|nr:sulfotransferase [Acidimicrobiia bacterium]